MARQPSLMAEKADVLHDRLATRDGVQDVVSCGGAFDVVTADRADKAARDCERVVRR